MNTVLIGILAFLAICLWWYFSEKRLRNKALENFSSSNGTFDEQAQNALKAIENIQNPTPKDHFLAARIIDLNAHEGRINNVHILNNVVDKYLVNLQPNIKLPALHKTDNTTDDGGNLDWFEIDQIENFAERHMDIIAANPQYNDFIEAVLEKRPKRLQATIQEAKSSSDTKKETFETYVASNVVNTSDSQNVHDSAVNEHLKKTYEKLRETTPPTLNQADARAEISLYISSTLKNDSDKKKKALHALDMMNNSKYNSTLETNEGDLLTLVWSRSKLPCNYETKTLIQDAVVDALVDMSDGKSVVCSNGRCARLMESLVCTDADQKTVNGAMTVQQIRNDAFKESNNILDDLVKQYSKYSADENLKRVAKSYTDPSIETKLEDEARFKSIVKEKIEHFINTSYAPRLSKRDYNNVKNHCLMAIDAI